MLPASCKGGGDQASSLQGFEGRTCLVTGRLDYCYSCALEHFCKSCYANLCHTVPPSFSNLFTSVPSLPGLFWAVEDLTFGGSGCACEGSAVAI